MERMSKRGIGIMNSIYEPGHEDFAEVLAEWLFEVLKAASF